MFSLLNIGLTGLDAQRQAMAVVGQNVANANTPGYHSESLSLSPTPLSQGGGVQTGPVGRAANTFLEHQSQDQTGLKGYWNTRKSGLMALQSVFNEPASSGLSGNISAFFSAWDALANAPTNPAARASVLQSGQTLTQAIHNVWASLQSQQQNLQTAVTSQVSQVNDALGQLATLNGNIARQSTPSPSSLDQRDRLVTQLSGLLGSRARINGQGQATVLLGGIPLLSGTHFEKVTATPTATGMTLSVPDFPLPQTAGGAIGGNLSVLSGQLPSVRASLTALTQNIMSSVNTQHAAGYGLSGTTGLSFFQGTGPADITVNPTLQANPSQLAAASASGQSADGTNAQAIYNLSQTPQGGASGTFAGQVASMLSGLGVQAQAAGDQAQSASDNLSATQNQIDSVSGVSTDAAATQLVAFQQAYQASAAFISVVNQSFAYLIQNV